jgi:putative ABC transport system substrate-binding protein
MNRRCMLLVLARGLAGLTAGALGSRLASAAEPTLRAMRLGIVSPDTPSTTALGVTAFSGHLRELGWVEGRNLITEQRWAEGYFERLPVLMAEVIGQNVDVLFTWTTPGAVAAKNATSTIPIVALGMGDPVRSGLVASLAHPGGNLTGVSMGYAEGFSGKWLELLQETGPRLSTVTVIVNPDISHQRDQAKDLKAAAPKRRLKVQIIEVREAEALDAAFAQARKQAQAVLVFPSPITMMNRARITTLAAIHRLPAMYGLRDFVDIGGLMAYAPDSAGMFRSAADYVDKILKGAKPADLPIEQPTQYVLVLNLKTAKTLGLTIPQSVLLQANEVIR